MKKRLDQDINFSVAGVPYIMLLDCSMMGIDHVGGDLWIIRQLVDSPETFSEHDLFSVFNESLVGLDTDGVAVRQPRQQYRYQINENHRYARLLVKATGDEWTLDSGIMASLPDWDGNSFDFLGSHRLARLLADLNDAVPGIQFTRSDGSVIEFEPFLNGGRDPITDHLWQLMDDLEQAFENDPRHQSPQLN